MPFRDGASIRQERINMGIDIVSKNPGILTDTWIGLMFKKTGCRVQTIERMLGEMLRYNLLEEMDERLYTYAYFKIKKIEEEQHRVSGK